MSSSALETVADYLADARTLLQDTLEEFRYDNESLVTALNVTLLETRRLRPDLFIFSKTGKVPFFTDAQDQPVDIEEPFRLAVLHGIVGHALERDQEDIQDARAGAFLKIFNDLLLGVRPSSIATGQPPAGN